MALATRNAAETLAREQARWLADEGKTLGGARGAGGGARACPAPPLRIECYDISNVQGSDSVGTMVVFEEGRPRTGRVPAVQDPDGRGANDFAATRRCCGAGSGGRRRATRAPRRRSAGRCRTS